MNDIIKPFDIYLTKKLHGHVRVETRSRWTGRVVDSQEKDNLITNALQNLLLHAEWGGSTSYKYSGMQTFVAPIYARALGGIMLFDSALTEQATNVLFPSSTKLVACAGQDANADNDKRGSLNADESVFISNGFTTVWDFLTSQANGTIASLARTSHLFPNSPAYYYNSQSSTYIYLDMYNNNGHDFGSNYTRYIGYDETNEYLYLYPNAGITLDGVTYSNKAIYRAKVSLNKIKLCAGLPPASQYTLVKTLTSADGSQNAYDWRYDQYANEFLYLSGNTLHVISASDGTHSTRTLGGSGYYWAVTENYYWRTTGSQVYRISKANLADVASYNISTTNLAAAGNDIVFFASSNWYILYPDGTTIKLGNGAYSGNVAECGPFYEQTDSNNTAYLYLKPNYLGTIANLDSPVTKTSSQTMKITYTLTEA